MQLLVENKFQNNYQCDLISSSGHLAAQTGKIKGNIPSMLQELNKVKSSLKSSFQGLSFMSSVLELPNMAGVF